MRQSQSFHRNALRLVVAAAAVSALAACSGEELTRTFGLTRDSPDEFQVTTRAPLSMPPDYTLRPPRPGAARPQEQSSATGAEAALVPQSALAIPAGTSSAGQAAFLNAAGPKAPADIRAKVEAERSLETPDQTLTDRLMFWRPTPQPGVVVDASKEAQRLRENSALGQNLEQGDTPIIQRSSLSKPGFLDSLF